MTDLENKKITDLEDKLKELTPVQDIGGVLVKRDDLFKPFSDAEVNGGKLRQAIHLLVQAKIDGFTRVLTGCSILSPQGPIITAVTKYLDLGCMVFYGGTNDKSLQSKNMPRLVRKYGGEIRLVSSGRHTVLYYEIKKIKEEKDFIVEYGMNSREPKHFVSFYETTANQVRNLPDYLDYLVVTCGSGITAAGIMYGLKKYNKDVKNIWLVGTAPNRIKKVKDRLVTLQMFSKIGNLVSREFNYVDLYGQGVKYEDREEDMFIGDVQCHPHYEAKVFKWLLTDAPFIFKQEQKILFWIVGSEFKDNDLKY
jgi:1-aminocyclopropane-1-carboxylate deaminase/D-cysteine desulfhydrase-like pyridoxal-dependent ACC family enzyme